MATAGQLRREINRLRSQLNDVNRQYSELRQSLQQQGTREIEKMQKDFNAALAKQKQMSDAEYARMFENFQNNLLRAQQARMDELKKQTQKYVDEQENYIRQIEELNRQITREFEEIKKQSSVREEFTKQYAREVYAQALEAKKNADEGPHSFFVPNQFDIIAGQEEKIAKEIENGLLQSAVADANSVAMQYDILSVKTKTSFNDWRVAFAEFSEIVRQLRANIDSFLEMDFNGMKLTEEECNFWSKGRFSELNEAIKSAEAMIREADEKGIVNYLKSIKNPNRSVIHSSLIQAKIWRTQLSAILNCVMQERTFSYERFSAGEDIVQLLEEDMYEVLKNKFSAPAPENASAPWYIMSKSEDPFERYEISATLNGLDKVNFHFIPVRNNGVVVRTECHIFVELQSIQSAAHETNSLMALERRFMNFFTEKNIRFVSYRYLSDNAVRSFGENAAAAVSRLENAEIKAADPDKQIQLMEKKYIL